MPDQTILYSVTAVVIAGLVAWVGVALKTAKEPWARPVPQPKSSVEVEEKAEAEAEQEKSAEPAEEKKAEISSPDATVEATPVVVPEKKADEEKKDEKS